MKMLRPPFAACPARHHRRVMTCAGESPTGPVKDIRLVGHERQQLTGAVWQLSNRERWKADASTYAGPRQSLLGRSGALTAASHLRGRVKAPVAAT